MKDIKNLVIIYLSLIGLNSCQEKLYCENKNIKVMEAAIEGNSKEVEKFLKSGGDPNFTCWTSDKNISIPSHSDLGMRIAITQNYDLIKMYLNYNVSLENQQYLLQFAFYHDTTLQNNQLIQLLVDHNIYYRSMACSVDDTATYSFLINNFGYDINNNNNDRKNTALLSYTSCDYYLSSDDMIEGIKYFIRKGADPKLTNINGDDIFKFVKDSIVIDYLKSL